MKNVLLVEDSSMFGKLAKRKIEKEFDIPVFWTRSMAETTALLEQAKGDFSAALVDVNLPDANDGEVIDQVLQHGITTFVFTSNVSEELRQHVWSKKVADYILKEDPNSLDYIISGMHQLQENQQTLVLVVDDSNTFRTLLSELLYVRKFRVLTAPDGKTALQILEKYPEIKLVLADYNMPEMDGYRLCQRIREKRKRDELAIIGISSQEDKSIGARFIKSGANDFIVKQSFLVEEFYSRVEDCLQTLELFARVKYAAAFDDLTGLHNRGYFFERAELLVNNCVDKQEMVSCTLFDVDFFKKVNDQHGHAVGDRALAGLAKILRENCSELELLARIGGEEFCLVTPSLDQGAIIERVEVLRQTIASTPVAELEDGQSLYITCSFGICNGEQGELEAMMKVADDNLYKAKAEGRDRLAW